MSNNVIKNPNREQPKKYVPYVPQYKKMGIEPMKSGNNAFGIQGKALLVNTKPATKFTPKPLKPTNVPYAEIAPPPPKTFKVPNVGNNIETAWSTISDEVIDDIDITEIDPNAPMIDNNDYYTGDFGVGSANVNMVEQIQSIEPPTTEDNVDVEEGQYLLAIDGTVMSVGTLENIQDEVRDLIFGDHKMYLGQPVQVEDIIVLKRIKINVGVFINE